MRYLLNAPVLTNYGEYRFEGPLGLDAARSFVMQDTQSAIGHDTTADFMTARLGVAVQSQRDSVRMQPGDQALVLRVIDRLPEGSVLDAETLSALPHEFGLLTRLR